MQDVDGLKFKVEVSSIVCWFSASLDKFVCCCQRVGLPYPLSCNWVAKTFGSSSTSMRAIVIERGKPSSSRSDSPIGIDLVPDSISP